MTTAEFKTKTAAALEELQRQGIWIREIEIDWRTNVFGFGTSSAGTNIECSLTLRADL